ELILEAVRAVRDPAAIREALGDLDRVLTPSADPLLRFQALRLSPTDGFVLSRIDGIASAGEIVQMIPLPAEDAERSLFGLLSTGVVEFAAGARRPRAPAEPAQPPPTPAATPTPRATEARAQPATDAGQVAERRREIVEAAAGIGNRTHFEVLGVPRTASEADIKEAYFRLARRFHPDVHHASSLADLRDSLEAVFIRLGQAYEVLRDPRRRAEYEERLGPRPPAPPTPTAPLPAVPATPVPAAPAKPARDHEEDVRVAEDSVRRAAKLFEKEKYWDAIQLLEPVVDRTTGRLYSKTRTLLARCYLKNPKWSRRAEEALLEVTRRDPAATDAWALLGGIYASKQMQNRALSMYRKALDLDPEHAEAASYLASHAPDEAAADKPAPGGVLKRLFRKS
ncbi:MAG TPA: DnaJ domain-containing protein, partial [Vicinamibacteria bacterium]|nr:DnaJ domain-containing protein [Vicinamibacteria bacterium]